MKITKKYLEQLIRESLKENAGRSQKTSHLRNNPQQSVDPSNAKTVVDPNMQVRSAQAPAAQKPAQAVRPAAPAPAPAQAPTQRMQLSPEAQAKMKRLINNYGPGAMNTAVAAKEALIPFYDKITNYLAQANPQISNSFLAALKAINAYIEVLEKSGIKKSNNTGNQE